MMCPCFESRRRKLQYPRNFFCLRKPRMQSTSTSMLLGWTIEDLHPDQTNTHPDDTNPTETHPAVLCVSPAVHTGRSLNFSGVSRVSCLGPVPCIPYQSECCIALPASLAISGLCSDDSCAFSAVSVWIAMPCASVCIFGMLVWLLHLPLSCRFDR